MNWHYVIEGLTALAAIIGAWRSTQAKVITEKGHSITVGNASVINQIYDSIHPKGN